MQTHTVFKSSRRGKKDETIKMTISSMTGPQKTKRIPKILVKKICMVRLLTPQFFFSSLKLSPTRQQSLGGAEAPPFTCIKEVIDLIDPS